MNLHQVLTGAVNAGDHCYSVGSVEGVPFTISAAYGKDVAIFEPSPLLQQTSAHKLDYKWIQTATIELDYTVSVLSWNLEGTRLLTGGDWIQLWRCTIQGESEVLREDGGGGVRLAAGPAVSFQLGNEEAPPPLPEETASSLSEYQRRQAAQSGEEPRETIPSLPSTYSVHDFHSFGLQGSGVAAGLHFHLAASINAETDIPLVPSLSAAASSNGHEPNFVLHWLNNKEMSFSSATEQLIQELSLKAIQARREHHRQQLAAQLKAAHDAAEEERELAGEGDMDDAEDAEGGGGLCFCLPSLGDALDRKIESLLREWHQSPDLLFSIHPVDGSFLVWLVDWLDECSPGSFRQALVSFSSRIPSAIPLGDAASLSHHLALYLPTAGLDLRTVLQGLGSWTQLPVPAVQLPPAEEAGPKPFCCLAAPSPSVCMLSKHHNGSLNLWHLTFSEESRFTHVLSIGHASRVSGHRFRINDITCHPVLPLLLTTSHHNLPRVKDPADHEDQLPRQDSKEERDGRKRRDSSLAAAPTEGFCSELILWKVESVGPLSKSGGVAELARINSLEPSAFSNVAWVPTLLPSTTLGSISNSPSACFVASDGRRLRVYQAVIDARTLLAEVQAARRRDNADVASVSSTTSSGIDAQHVYLQDDFRIVSLQSTARPGCVVELDAIAEATHDWQNTQLLHVFQEQLIVGAKSGGTLAGVLGPQEESQERQVGLLETSYQAFVDLRHSSDFEEPFYLVVLEKAESGRSALHMWRLVISSRASTDGGMAQTSGRLPEDLPPHDSDHSLSSRSNSPELAASGQGGPNSASPRASPLRITTCKVCTQELPLPQGVEIAHASPAAGHLSSSNIYPACFAPYVLSTACSDGLTRFWKCLVDRDEKNNPSYAWVEWEMTLNKASSAIPVPGTPLSVSCAYSGRVACAYKRGQSFTRPTSVNPSDRFVNLGVAIYECESTGGSEWILEDTVLLNNVSLARMDQTAPGVDLAPLMDSTLRHRKTADTLVQRLTSDGDLSGPPAGSLQRLLAVPSYATLHTLRRAVIEQGNQCPLVHKSLVQLDWVSSEDGSHVLTVAVGSRVLLFTPVSQDLIQQGGGGLEQRGLGSGGTRPLLKQMSSLGAPVAAAGAEAVRWLQIRCTKLETADGLPALPMQLSWVRDGILVVGMDSEMHIYSQWRPQKGAPKGMRGAPQCGAEEEDLCRVRMVPEEELLGRVQEMSQLRLGPGAPLGLARNASSSSSQALDKKKIRVDASSARLASAAKESEMTLGPMPDLGLFETSRLAWPMLPQYHPKQLMELLGFGKIRRVKAILSHLVRCVSKTGQLAKSSFQAHSNPLDAALFYMALKKKNILAGLFRSVSDKRMSDFFQNNFVQDRWRKAALKNAYVLLGKQQFEHAAAFFLLAGSVKDAVQPRQLRPFDSSRGHANFSELASCVFGDAAGELAQNADPGVFNFYLYLRTHPLVVRRHLAKSMSDRRRQGRAVLLSGFKPGSPVSKTLATGGGDTITPLERRLFFTTSHAHFRAGCPPLALEVLSRLPNCILDEDATLAEDGSTGNREDLANGQPLAADVEDAAGNKSLKQQDASEDAQSQNRVETLDIMAQQLKFMACLKIMMEELSTLATGFEVDGGQLRHQLYLWLERCVAALKELCQYGATMTSLHPDAVGEASSVDGANRPFADGQLGSAGGGPVPTLHAILVADKQDFEAKLVRAARRKLWLKANEALLRTLLSYTGLHGAHGGGLAAVRMELNLLLQELQQDRSQQQLLSPLPFPTTLPLLAASVACQKTVVADPVRLLQLMAQDILQTVVEFQEPPGAATSASTFSRVSVLWDLGTSLSACIYQALCDSDSFGGKAQGTNRGLDNSHLLAGHAHRRPRLSSSEEPLTPTTLPSKWPGVQSLRALMARDKDEDGPRLHTLLCESFVAVFLSQLIHALASCDCHVLFRLVGQRITKQTWGMLFGGGAKKLLRVTTSGTSGGTTPSVAPESEYALRWALHEGCEATATVETGIFDALTRQRVKWNMKILPQLKTEAPQTKEREDRPTYRELFVPPVLSMMSCLMSKPSLPDQWGPLDYDSAESVPSDEEEAGEDEDEDHDEDDVFGDLTADRRRASQASRLEQLDPGSYAWALMRYATLKLAQHSLRDFLAVAGIELQELPVTSPLLHASLRSLDHWLRHLREALEAHGGPPPGLLPNSYVEGAGAPQGAPTQGPPILKYKVLLELDNTPFSRSRHPAALPARRLWNYLVRQEEVQELFIRYLFSHKVAPPTEVRLPKNTRSFRAACRSRHPAALPARRLWNYLVRQEEVQELFIRYLFSHKVAPPTEDVATVAAVPASDAGDDRSMDGALPDPVRIIHKDQESISAFCVSQVRPQVDLEAGVVNDGILALATPKELQELDITVLLEPAPWLDDEAEFDILNLNRYHLSGCQDGSVSLWEWGHTQPVSTPRLAGTFAKVTSLLFNQQGNKFGVTDGDGNLSLWQVGVTSPNAKPFFSASCHSKQASDFAFVSSSSLIATAGHSNENRNVCLWDTLLPHRKALVSGEEAPRDPRHGSSAVVFAPQNQLLISAGKKGDICILSCWSLDHCTAVIFDVRQRQLRHKFQAHDTAIKCLAVDPREEYYISGSADGDIKVWGLSVHVLLYAFPNEHSRSTLFRNIGMGVTHLSTDAHGRLYSCGADGSMKLRQLPDRDAVVASFI
ncbi:dual oxidase maturation factor, putative [Ixodes scapularis]|uniref:Dual oxidase maturation factor, putative n=1 Tax=Ixodes scapularis TaxID=6945 RepID=B7Q5C5_IXOSC|nr:dual oxidase maturation factor, putative [Ixodes scapularis]|eukprot:XP_002411733.1 dual oxidase maturation factor, putative [Ixodes scapularis]